MQLGRLLGLPIPVGFVLENDSELYYCSAHSAMIGGDAPDADLDQLAQDDPRLMCGIAIFDAWTGNIDRHSRNIYYEDLDRVVILWDHGAALLNYEKRLEHLEGMREKIVLHSDFASEIRDFSSLADWYTRLVSIPDEMIEETVNSASIVGIGPNVSQGLVRLLIERRRNLLRLFDKHQKMFPKYERNLFCPFSNNDDDPTDYQI